jgi:hypothetical protein
MFLVKVEERKLLLSFVAAEDICVFIRIKSNWNKNH